jgi:Uma2 family endonuclease
VLSWPDHLLTLQEWDALPDDNRYRLEVVEGVLLVAPRPITFHQRAVTRLGYLINEELPPHLCALSEVDLIINERPLTVRAPGVLVTTTALADTNPARYRPQDTSLTVEILSEGSVRTDRVMKVVEYAEVGIRHYWIVDLTPPVSLTAYHLIDQDYELFGEHTGATTLDLDGATISLDLAALTTSRAQRP